MNYNSCASWRIPVGQTL